MGSEMCIRDSLKGGQPLTQEQRGTVLWQLDIYKKMQRRYPKPKPFATEVARRGKWKMLSRKGEPVELFDTESDPNETINLLGSRPELTSSLREKVAEFLAAPRTPVGNSKANSKTE